MAFAEWELRMKTIEWHFSMLTTQGFTQGMQLTLQHIVAADLQAGTPAYQFIQSDICKSSNGRHDAFLVLSTSRRARISVNTMQPPPKLFKRATTWKSYGSPPVIEKPTAAFIFSRRYCFGFLRVGLISFFQTVINVDRWKFERIIWTWLAALSKRAIHLLQMEALRSGAHLTCLVDPS